ncbi:hypothetical protein D3C87_1578950 [compost metagenome]
MKKKIIADASSAAIARIQKMACQLNHTSTAPPIMGASNGAMVVTSMTNDIMRENSSFG